MTIDEAFSTFDWATYHSCGHPVQRFQGNIAPCSYCWKRGANRWSIPAPIPADLRINSPDTLRSTGRNHDDIRLRLTAYVARDVEAGCKGVGRIWVLED